MKHPEQNRQKLPIHRGGMPKGHKTAKVASKELAREALRQIVTQHMQEMTEAQVAAAKGLKYLVKRSKIGGKFEVVTEEQAKAGIFDRDDLVIEVWDKQPSTPAFTDLMNRALDKPAEQKQELELTGTGTWHVIHELGDGSTKKG